MLQPLMLRTVQAYRNPQSQEFLIRIAVYWFVIKRERRCLRLQKSSAMFLMPLHKPWHPDGPAGRCSCARESWRGTACVLRPVRGQGWLLRVGIAGVRRCSWRGWRLRRLWLRYTWRCTPFCPVGQCLRSAAQSRAGPTQNKGTARRSAAAGEEAGGLRIWPPAG